MFDGIISRRPTKAGGAIMDTAETWVSDTLRKEPQKEIKKLL